MVVKKIKEGFAKVFSRVKEQVEDYIEIDLGAATQRKAKILIRPFILKVFEDINPILNAIREGYTIALINIKSLKEKDIVELKRVVNKLKKTCDAIEGDIAGFGEDWIVVTPSFANVYRTTEIEEVKD